MPDRVALLRKQSKIRMSASFVSGKIIPMFALAFIGIPALALLAVIGVVVWRLRTRAKMPDTVDGQETPRAADDRIVGFREAIVRVLADLARAS